MRGKGGRVAENGPPCNQSSGNNGPTAHPLPQNHPGSTTHLTIPHSPLPKMAAGHTDQMDPRIPPSGSSYHMLPLLANWPTTRPRVCPPVGFRVTLSTAAHTINGFDNHMGSHVGVRVSTRPNNALHQGSSQCPSHAAAAQSFPSDLASICCGPSGPSLTHIGAVGGPATGCRPLHGTDRLSSRRLPVHWHILHPSYPQGAQRTPCVRRANSWPKQD